MAFGKFSMVSRQAKPRKPVEEKKPPESKMPPMVFDRGASVMEILLIAPTCEEAEDFLCGCYFDIIQAVGGSRLTAYTKEFSTITRLTEIKQLMEETILKPAGRELLRKTPEDGVPFEQGTITLGQAGNPALAVDLHFTWSSPSLVAGRQADAVFVLLNCAQPQAAQICIHAARQAAAGYPLIWVVSGFENKKVIWSEDGNSTLSVQLRRELRELLGLTSGAGEYAAYVQLYGGMEFVGRTDGSALLRSDRRCREYMPMGCHVPVFVAMDAVRRFRSNQETNHTGDLAMEKLWQLMQVHRDTLKGWYDTQTQKGASGT